MSTRWTWGAAKGDSQDEERTPLLGEQRAGTRRTLASSDASVAPPSVWRPVKLPLSDAEFVVSVFGPPGSAPTPPARVDDTAFYEGVERVRQSIAAGLNPRMIATGTSGSYFVRIKDGDHSSHVFGVFKPMDEEPYGNLNPKRRFLRKYLWWAMGRPCLIPNFSYLSEVGASFLDDRLELGLVPKTRLVGLVSSAFHYLYSDRKRYETGVRALPIKLGSLQEFLPGYVNASAFLKEHALPGRPASMFERDLAAENEAHRLSRRRQRARVRMCFIALKRLLLCRYGPGPYGAPADAEEQEDAEEEQAADADAGARGFVWTERTQREFRLELEKLVLLDFLMRNTDRGLDNFMVHVQPDAPRGTRSLRIGAIDNSLSFPHQHPRGLRDYPYGWLFLPTSVIGQRFSDETREVFLPKLSDPAWWHHTVAGLRRIFSQDAHFNERVFEQQMDVIRGQGYNIVQCLRAGTEGPIELCARPKRLVRESMHMLSLQEVRDARATPLHPEEHQLLLQRGVPSAVRPPPPAIDTPQPRRAAGAALRDGTQSVPARHAPLSEHAHAHATEPLAIEIVERIDQLKASSRAPRTRRRASPGAGAAGAGAAAGGAPSNGAPGTAPVAHSVTSLDLADGLAARPATPPAAQDVRVPVAVQQLDTETRSAWLKWI